MFLHADSMLVLLCGSSYNDEHLTVSLRASLFFLVLRPVKIISLILSRVKHSKTKTNQIETLIILFSYRQIQCIVKLV